MTQENTDQRHQTYQALNRAIDAEASVVGAILIGSAATDSADEHSDLDYYVYVEGKWWSAERLSAWLEGAGLTINLHYWTGLGKHRLLVGGTRVDISFGLASQRAELALWPQLFFAASSILKDTDGVLARAYAANPQLSIRDQRNDYAGYVLNLISVAVQLLRGEVVNARSRFMGVIEARARIPQQLPIGSALWREPTRHVEEHVRPELAQELQEIAFIGSPSQLATWIAKELLLAADDVELAHGARQTCWTYSRALTDWITSGHLVRR